MSEIVVDIHPHVVSRDTARYPITPIGGKQSDWSHKRSVSVEELVASMDEAGVVKAAVVHSSTTYGFDCAYVADATAAYPDRLTGVFSVDVLEPDAPAAMARWLERGLTGMRIFSRGSTLEGNVLALDDERIFPCYALAAERGIPVVTNTTVKEAEQLRAVLERFPGVNFILDHLGKADFTGGAPFVEAEPLFRLARHPNLYLKPTTGNFAKAGKGKSTAETMFGKLVAEFGADRLAWGSNFPASEGSLGQLLDIARQGLSALPTADRDWILGGTALKLYPALAR